MRPDPTPPDPSLFPIAPTFTADLDAKALDEIRDELRRMWTWLEANPEGVETALLRYAQLACNIQAKLLTTGREV